MTAPDPGLSVVLPALNEAAGIERTLDALADAADRLTGVVGQVEVVVVDDGSTDATAALVAARARRDPRVHLVRHARNRGLGAAVRTGLAAARGRVVCYTDADLPFDLAELDEMVAQVLGGEVAVVSAYRSDRGGEGLRRWVYSYAYNLLVRSALGLRVRDVNFAGKVLRREALEAVALRSEGSFIDAELLAKVDRLGFAIAQVEVRYFPRSRGVSTLSSLGVVVGILREMRAIRPEIVALGRGGPRR